MLQICLIFFSQFLTPVKQLVILIVYRIFQELYSPTKKYSSYVSQFLRFVEPLYIHLEKIRVPKKQACETFLTKGEI